MNAGDLFKASPPIQPRNIDVTRVPILKTRFDRQCSVVFSGVALGVLMKKENPKQR